MLKFIRETFGNGLKISEVESEIENYLDVDTFLEIMEEVAQDGEITGDVYEDFYILDEEEYQESMEGFNSWYSLDIAIKNVKLGMVFIGGYGGDVDEYGGREDIELMDDIKVYKITEEFKEKLEEFNRQKEIRMEELRKKYEKEREEFRIMREEREKELKKEKKEIKKAKKNIEKVLLEQGFEQCKSLKGNLISQYEADVYVLNNKIYDTFEEVVDAFERKYRETLNVAGRDYLMRRVKKKIRYKISNKSELGVVKKYTSKGIVGILELYAHNVNTKKSYNYHNVYMGYRSKEFVGSELGLFELMEKVLEDEERKERERRESFAKVMSEIMSGFR